MAETQLGLTAAILRYNHQVCPWEIPPYFPGRVSLPFQWHMGLYHRTLVLSVLEMGMTSSVLVRQ